MILTLSELPNFKRQIKNIIFDFGGVLFDIDYKRPIEAFAQLGLKNFEKFYEQSSQIPMFDKFEVGEIEPEDFISEIKSQLSDNVSSAQIVSAWNAILLTIPKSRIDLIHDLKKNHKTFLLSNTNAIHVDAFERVLEEEMGLEYFKNAFNQVYYSNVIGKKKPNPNTFDWLCQKNRLLKSETLFIDDSIQHVEGASKAGLYSFHLDPKKMDVEAIFNSWV